MLHSETAKQLRNFLDNREKEKPLSKEALTVMLGLAVAIREIKQRFNVKEKHIIEALELCLDYAKFGKEIDADGPEETR